MLRISINKDIYIKWEISNYGISINNEVYNLLTYKKIKQTMVNSSIGYYLNGRFRTLKYIKENCRLYKDKYCPF